MMLLKPVDNKKTYLVTGAVGFIGLNVAQRLLDLGYAVIGVDNINNYYDVSLKYARLDVLKKYERFTFYKIDLADKGTLENMRLKSHLQFLFREHAIDVVIHLAAQAGVCYSIENPQAYIQSNVVGFFNILECQLQDAE